MTEWRTESACKSWQTDDVWLTAAGWWQKVADWPTTGLKIELEDRADLLIEHVFLFNAELQIAAPCHP